jgi:hypothetical protein
VKIELQQLHRGQSPIYESPARFKVVRCGRRFGKTILGITTMAVGAVQGQSWGWFAPTYALLDDPWRDFSRRLAPITVKANKQEKRISLTTGGTLDFWTMDGDDPGRSRKYHGIVIDEAGLVPHMIDTWNAAIRPTLTDYKGTALILGTPKGRRGFQEMFLWGEQGRDGWASFKGKTIDNPAIDPAEVHAAKAYYAGIGRLDIFRQEFEGEPCADGGNPFGWDAIAACVGELSQRNPVVFGIDLAKSSDWTVVVGLDDEGRVCILERWQSDWKQTLNTIRRTIGDVPTTIDSTGVGDPIVEQLCRECPNVEGFKFTSTSKQQLMEGLAAAIHGRSITIPSGWLVAELESFEFEYRGSRVAYSAPPGLHDDGVCALALAVYGQNGTSSRAVDAAWIEL